MKTLYLVRHAKSDWAQPGHRDIDRPLLPKGHVRTERILHFLHRKEVKPQCIMASPAVRAVETARLLARGIGYPEHKILIDKRIYASDEETLLDIIAETDDALDSLMMIGHNPEMTHLAHYFRQTGIEYLPTTAVVALHFNTQHWNQVARQAPELAFYIHPKALE